MGLPVGEGDTWGTVYGFLCPGLGVGPAGGAGLLEFDGGFAGGFVFSEGTIKVGEDFGGGFDGEEGKASNITSLIIDSRIQSTQNRLSQSAIHQTTGISNI